MRFLCLPHAFSRSSRKLALALKLILRRHPVVSYTALNTLAFPHGFWAGYLQCSTFPVRSPTRLPVRYIVRSLGVSTVRPPMRFPFAPSFLHEANTKRYPTANLGQHPNYLGGHLTLD